MAVKVERWVTWECQAEAVEASRGCRGRRCDIRTIRQEKEKGGEEKNHEIFKCELLKSTEFGIKKGQFNEIIWSYFH